jgi:hypothetical protein
MPFDTTSTYVDESGPGGITATVCVMAITVLKSGERYQLYELAPVLSPASRTVEKPTHKVSSGPAFASTVVNERMFTVILSVQPLASVTFTLYAPGNNPVMSCVTCAPGDHR